MTGLGSAAGPRALRRLQQGEGRFHLYDFFLFRCSAGLMAQPVPSAVLHHSCMPRDSIRVPFSLPLRPAGSARAVPPPQRTHRQLDTPPRDGGQQSAAADSGTSRRPAPHGRAWRGAAPPRASHPIRSAPHASRDGPGDARRGDATDARRLRATERTGARARRAARFISFQPSSREHARRDPRSPSC